MAKPKTKNRRARMAAGRSSERHLDASPERLAKGDDFEFINPAKIDSSEQPIGNVRRFRKTPHLDRWHNNGVITQRQWWAGDAYRRLYEGMQNLPRVVSSYGERTTGGEPDYGLARTDAQARRRVSFRAARSMLPLDVLGLVDKLLLRNDLPEYRGRKQMHAIEEARRGLDALATHFECRRADQSLDDRNILLYGNT
jgi:hypothetical protein